ncbi:MBL fold metallo-hydrolase [Litorilinea aerophila]|uniref:MBL fold metallo-hydrolase n=1 Tax=Litorilinea aerophila TaxID=1204385 RepID=A0A540VLF8_9CHLR|nr:MBL fold metallo-hydrolase [Litorilinea aerophila]MCC9075438.1 MBL fold metallo-hydrolase [Litorilinea aerophila]
MNYICTTCGTQFAETDSPPDTCPICADERQYIGWEGQRWTTLAELQADYHNVIKTAEPGLTGIGTHPHFAIGQRALLVQTPQGNVLWDCISLLDDPTIAAVEALGGIQAIAISHPHFYSSMVEWGRAFQAPIYLHESDRRWVMRPDPAIHFWQGETLSLWDGVTLIRCGGHFAGSTVLHWRDGAEGQGVLLTGDTLQVVSDRRYVSFMRSYPNLIPLSAAAVRRIVDALAPYSFERIYGGWWDRVVAGDAQAAVARSAARYLQALQAEGGATGEDDLA